MPDGTRIGIVAFANGAYPLGPLTDDRDAARDALARLPDPNGGTAIGDALDRGRASAADRPAGARSCS